MITLSHNAYRYVISVAVAAAFAAFAIAVALAVSIAKCHVDRTYHAVAKGSHPNHESC